MLGIKQRPEWMKKRPFWYTGNICHITFYILVPILEEIWYTIPNHQLMAWNKIFYGGLMSYSGIYIYCNPYFSQPRWQKLKWVMYYVSMFWEIWICSALIFVFFDYCWRQIKKKMDPGRYHNQLKSQTLRLFLKPIVFFAEPADIFLMFISTTNYVPLIIRFRFLPHIIGQNLRRYQFAIPA